MIVADASAIVKVLLQTPAASCVSERMFASRETLHAPHLLDVEVAQVARLFVRLKVISPARGEQALSVFADLPIRHYPHLDLLPRIWQLRHKVTA